METISAFIDGGGSVLVAASSDIGKSALGRCWTLHQFSMELRELCMQEMPAWPGQGGSERNAGLSGPGTLMGVV